jgi:hypothetical protein
MATKSERKARGNGSGSRTIEESARGMGDVLNTAAEMIGRGMAATAEMAGQVVARGAELTGVTSSSNARPAASRAKRTTKPRSRSRSKKR